MNLSDINQCEREKYFPSFWGHILSQWREEPGCPEFLPVWLLISPHYHKGISSSLLINLFNLLQSYSIFFRIAQVSTGLPSFLHKPDALRRITASALAPSSAQRRRRSVVALPEELKISLRSLLDSQTLSSLPSIHFLHLARRSGDEEALWAPHF